MRFMIQVRATATSERGDPPGPEYAELFEQMGAFHEEMARAGVLLDVPACVRAGTAGASAITPTARWSASTARLPKPRNSSRVTR